MKRLSLLVLLFAFSVSSCRYFGGERVVGDGNVVKQQKKVGSFSAIDVSGSIQLHISQDAAYSVTMETDNNLLEYLDIYNDGEVLVVKSKDGFNLKPTEDIIVYVSAPSFTSIDVSGACAIFGDSRITGTNALKISASGASTISLDVDLPKLTTDVSGSSDIDLRGSVSDLVIQASGASKISAMNLLTQNADLDLSGASEVELTATRAMKVEASGASNIRYRGDAAVTQSVSGAGSVTRVQ
ncbi:MAG: DUF2807 domain-containing protein [Flavisolibacter sp.]|jgi:hypothetical protein|nr:DUF2807 domain-containing protein [Flavisolibacter sp.]